MKDSCMKVDNMFVGRRIKLLWNNACLIEGWMGWWMNEWMEKWMNNKMAHYMHFLV